MRSPCCAFEPCGAIETFVGCPLCPSMMGGSDTISDHWFMVIGGRISRHKISARVPSHHHRHQRAADLGGSEHREAESKILSTNPKQHRHQTTISPCSFANPHLFYAVPSHVMLRLSSTQVLRPFQVQRRHIAQETFTHMHAPITSLKANWSLPRPILNLPDE